MLDTKALGLPSLAAIGITVAVALIVFLVVWSLSSSSQPANRSRQLRGARRHDLRALGFLRKGRGLVHGRAKGSNVLVRDVPG